MNDATMPVDARAEVAAYLQQALGLVLLEVGGDVGRVHGSAHQK